MEEKIHFYPGQTEPPYIGEDRIVSHVGKFVVTETTNSVKAFDIVLPFQIPHKGVVLNLMSINFLKATEDIIPNCLIAVPHPRVSIWKKTTPFKFEVMVNEDYPVPSITQTIKTENGDDQNITLEELIGRGYCDKQDWDYIEAKAKELFRRGQRMADDLGLNLVNTKYKFGQDGEGIHIISEVHSPSSSTYWYKGTKRNVEPHALTQQFLDQWLIDQGFQGRPGDIMPEFPEEFVRCISKSYRELYKIMGLPLYELPIEEHIGDLYSTVKLWLQKN